MNSPSLGSQRRQLFILRFLFCLERRFETNLRAIPWLKERGERRGGRRKKKRRRRRRRVKEPEWRRVRDEQRRTSPKARRKRRRRRVKEFSTSSPNFLQLLIDLIIIIFGFWVVFNQLLFQTSPPIFSNFYLFMYLFLLTNFSNFFSSIFFFSWSPSPTSPKKIWNETLQFLSSTSPVFFDFSPPLQLFNFCLAIYLAPPCFPIHASPMQEEMGIGKLSIFKPYFVSPLVGFNF